MKAVILGSFADTQTAIYILEAMYNFCSDVYGIDIKKINKEKGVVKGQEVILDEVIGTPFNPNLILVLKGLEISPATLKKIKESFPNAKFLNWFFDKYLLDKPIWESDEYLKTLPIYDYFFCSLKGVSDKLNEHGFENARYLDEACRPAYHNPQHCNFFQGEKYGADIAFVGSLGFTLQHPDRIPTLVRLVKDGFRIKIWGDVFCDWGSLPSEIRGVHMKMPVINDNHSRVVTSSLINLGIDQDVEIDRGHSARLYRVLCAGGLYLTNATKGLDEMFKVNKRGDRITGKEEIGRAHV